MRVKAVFNTGAWLNKNGGNYVKVPEIDYSRLTSRNIAEIIYGISLKYHRRNGYGYGVSRGKKPVFKMRCQQRTASDAFVTPVYVKNADVIDVTFMLSNKIKTISEYQLVDIKDHSGNDLSIISPLSLSNKSDIPLEADGEDGFIRIVDWKYFLYDIYAYCSGATTSFGYNFADFNDFGFKIKNEGEKGTDFSTGAHVTLSKSYLKKFIVAAIEANQTDPQSFTYYQYQYAIITRGIGENGLDGKVYVTPEEAEAFCKANYPWCADTAEDMEGGDSTA